MTFNGLLQIFVSLVALILLARPLGTFMARVYTGQRTLLNRALGPVERLIYRSMGIDPSQEMDWKTYTLAMLTFNLLGLLVVYLLQRNQQILPLNPQGMGAVTPDSSFNTAISFATNTNWQGYGGETTMSYLTQMARDDHAEFRLGRHGYGCVGGLYPGLRTSHPQGLGNFWADLTRTILYILLPLSTVLALALVSQGVEYGYSIFPLARPGCRRYAGGGGGGGYRQHPPDFRRRFSHLPA